MSNTEPVVEFNRQLMAEDAAAKGLTKLRWSQKAKVSDMTVIRFLRGDSVTAPMVAKLAKALGQPVDRYIVRKAVA
jgi:plasmid maintenance system antidote protein VapI